MADFHILTYTANGAILRAMANLEEKVEIARVLAGITEEIPEPEAKKK